MFTLGDADTQTALYYICAASTCHETLNRDEDQLLDSHGAVHKWHVYRFPRILRIETRIWCHGHCKNRVHELYVTANPTGAAMINKGVYHQQQPF